MRNQSSKVIYPSGYTLQLIDTHTSWQNVVYLIQIVNAASLEPTNISISNALRFINTHILILYDK